MKVIGRILGKKVVLGDTTYTDKKYVMLSKEDFNKLYLMTETKATDNKKKATLSKVENKKLDIIENTTETVKEVSNVLTKEELGLDK